MNGFCAGEMPTYLWTCIIGVSRLYYYSFVFLFFLLLFSSIEVLDSVGVSLANFPYSLSKSLPQMREEEKVEERVVSSRTFWGLSFTFFFFLLFVFCTHETAYFFFMLVTVALW